MDRTLTGLKVANLVLLAIALMLVLSARASAAEEPSTGLQLGAITPVAPDLDLNLGLTGSLRVASVKGHSIFADLLVVREGGDTRGALGASVEALGELRAGGTIWASAVAGKPRWELYLVKPLLNF